MTDHTTSRTGRTQSIGYALTVAERSFQLLTTGPDPLAIDGRTITGGHLPQRRIDLHELQTLLLDAGIGGAVKDAVWAQLVRHARSGDPAWVIGCVGVAMPGLKNAAARVVRTTPSRHADDIVSELLTEFVAQLPRIDTDRPRIAARLIFWARKGAMRARSRELHPTARDPRELPAPPASHEPAPVELLLQAAQKGITTAADAELIIATRLDGLTLQHVARQQGVTTKTLYNRRHRAEARLLAAIRDGELCGRRP
ncbi:RNA polymerase sigma factor [Actinomadura sp. LOL_016]|uniref:RNA polymerase sigma factor n=1 Tax=unclassified Actinomadura TaxID=2626254 RepID=UPI003A81040C